MPMHVAIFTPTHDPRWLADCARSVAYQSELGLRLHVSSSVSWWIGVNGGRVAEVMETVRGIVSSMHDGLEGELKPVDVHIIDLSHVNPSGSIGAVKRALCDAALEAGADALLELDHDDILHPEAVGWVASAFWGHPKAAARKNAVAYSDFAEFRDGTNEPHAYSSAYGWRSRPIVANAPGTGIDGAQLVAMSAFDVGARSLCQITYAPNHLRAWTRGAYLAAGGHDPAMSVCDDHDLLIRCWLSGAGFVHITQCLYYYRLGANTYAGPANARIQAASGTGVGRYRDGTAVPDFAARVELRDKHLHGLIMEDLRRRPSPRVRGGALALDLGGGVGRSEGAPWTAVDLSNGDVRRDLRRGLPYADGSAYVIRAFDVLEHLDPNDAAFLIGECWRVLCHGGWLLTRTPADHGVGAACDLSHKSRWNTRTWAYFWSPGLLPYRNAAFPELAPGVGGNPARFAMFRPVRVLEETVTMGPYPCKWDVPYVIADLQVDKGGDWQIPGPRFDVGEAA